jgi:hypothetical protein
MQAHFPSQQELMLQTCAWCYKRIADPAASRRLGVRLRKGVDLTAQMGRVVMLSMKKSGKNVPALVLPAAAPERQAGYDLALRTCGAACAQALQQALEDEVGAQVGPADETVE